MDGRLKCSAGILRSRKPRLHHGHVGACRHGKPRLIHGLKLRGHLLLLLLHHLLI